MKTLMKLTDEQLKTAVCVAGAAMFATVVVMIAFAARPEPCADLANSVWVYECAQQRPVKECLEDAKVVLNCSNKETDPR